ncbi:MAG: hypothetical protein J0I12_34840 [Candidatus Eremiobacteraeota bacterium]|nr:hypothetical protein [Candidatus Eremiobacteraeota bacterium]
MLKNAVLIFALAGAALAAPPPWNNPAQRTELRQDTKVDGRQADKAVKPPLKDAVESHYLLRNPDERQEYLSRRKIVAKPSKAKVPMRSAKDHDPDVGTYYYVPNTP